MWLQVQRLKVQPRDFNCMFYVLYRWSAERFATERVTDMVWGGRESRAGLRGWMRDPERVKEGEKDNQKTIVCQYRHASICQLIPLWLIWKGWFLARRTLEALTRLLLHSSASHKASVCSNWPWIRSYWLEVSKINKHNKAVLYARTFKILTRCSMQKRQDKQTK